ncbi:MAG: MFS transporter [Alphaproteobacteria bacterium]|nr:MFS transporter [Alphaproteobacteria bacterium]
MLLGVTIKSIDERYLIVLGACLTQFFVIGLLFSYGLFFKSFELEYGWSRTLLSSCVSLAFLVMGILAFVGGRLNDRYGPRMVLSVAGTLCGVGYVLLSQVTQPWQLFVLFGMFIGVGMATHDVVTLSTIARWFHQRRGMMTGVVKTGTAAGQIAVPPSAAVLIAYFGWRPALIILGCVAVVMLLIAASLMKSPPADHDSISNTASSGMTFDEARRTSLLWMFCAIQFCFFPTLSTVPLHIVVHGMDLGMTPALAAILLSVIGASSVVGRLTFGTLADRIGGKRALLSCFVPLLVSLLAFLLINIPWVLFGAVALYGFAHGGLFTAVSPTVAEYFGLKAHGAIFGLILLFGTIGGALGPILAGWAFDQTASYSIAFSSLAALLCFGLVLVLRLPPSPVQNPPG